MSENFMPVVKLPPVEQIGIVVKHLDRAVEFYSSVFGWGPFQIREAELKDFTHRDRQGNCRLKMAFARSGPIEIELIEVLEGETPHTEFLQRKGEGLHHLRFRVENFDAMLRTLADNDVEPVFHQVFPGVAAFAYLNTDKVGGVILELFELNKRGRDKR